MSRWILFALFFLIVVITAGFITLPSSDLSESKIVHYDFDEDAVLDETILDGSGERNHGTIIAEDDQRPDFTDGAMRFEEGSYHIVLDLDDQPLEDDFTIVVQAKNGYQEHFAGVVTSYSWRIVAPYNRYGFYTPEEGIDSDSYEEEEWKHLTAIHRDGTFELYVDGEFVDKFEISEEVETERIYIGQRPGGYWFDGEIAEVQIYDRAVSQTEVRAVYADRPWLPPAVFTTEFRLGTAIVIAVIAIGTAGHEVRNFDD